MANPAAIAAAKAAYIAACQAAFPAYTAAVEAAYNLYYAQVAAIQAQYDNGNMQAELDVARGQYNQAIVDTLATQAGPQPNALPPPIPIDSAKVTYSEQIVAITNDFAQKRRPLNDELNAAKAALDRALVLASFNYQTAIRPAKLNLEAALGVASPPGVVGQPIN